MTVENKGYSLALSNGGNNQIVEKIYLKPMALYVPEIAVDAITELTHQLKDKDISGEKFTLTVTNKNNGVSVNKHFSTLSELEDPAVSADVVKELVYIVRGYETDEESNVCGW